MSMKHLYIYIYIYRGKLTIAQVAEKSKSAIEERMVPSQFK